MFDFGFAILIVTAAAPAGAPVQFAMQTVEQRIVIRIPTRPIRRPRRRAPTGLVWREEPASECQPADEIARARFTRPGTVDLLMRDRRIVRAVLDAECVSLGYYSAFYLVPGEDGRICAGRDAIVSRAGSECTISAFRRLEANPAG